MIEINLIAKKKATHLPVILGIDLNLINFKAVLIVTVLCFAAKSYFEMTWGGELKDLQNQIETTTAESKKLDEQTKSSNDLKKQLDAYQKQIVKLQDRSKVVEEVLKTRNNPRALLERLARNAPSDLWFTTLILDDQRNLEVKGRSLSYKSIGDFSVLVGESRFLNGRKLELKSSETVEEKDGDYSRRVESFTLAGKVESY